MDSQKKTIFITVNRAIIVRNLLLNPAFAFFSQNYNIVIFSPLYNDPEFREKFKNYSIEPLYERSLSPLKRKLEQFFLSLHKSLIYNPTIKVCSEYGLMLRNPVRFKRLRNVIEKYFLGKVLGHEPIRNFFKWIDGKIFSCNVYDEVIKLYKPDLVFITAMGADNEIAFLRNCKRRDIPSVGMAMSWDNLSKTGFREHSDKFILWSQYMKEEAVAFQDYKSHQLQIVGIPQFDYYVESPQETKEEFYKRFGLDPKKRIILFGSEGPVCPDDPYIVSFLSKKIQEGTLKEFQILVRPHFAYRNDVERFFPFVDRKNVFIDTFYETSKFKDGTALSLLTVKNLSTEIKFSDVAITSTSTLVLDIIANGKLPILYNFDKDKSLPFKDSIRRLYETLWFRQIRSIGLNNMASSEEELIQKIQEFAHHPNREIEKREVLLKRFCFTLDGQSGKRLFNFIDQILLEQQNKEL